MTASTLLRMREKATDHLPEELKLVPGLGALQPGSADAQESQNAVAVTGGLTTMGLFDGESLSGRVEELLTGLGER